MDRSSRPKAIGEINFELPEINTFVLKNGLKVFYVEKNKLPIVNISLVSSSGSKYDSKGLNGIAYLTSLLIDEGADGIGALEIADTFDSLGSLFGVSSDKDSVYISLLSLKEHFKKSFNMFSKVITKPDFTDLDFEREHQKLKSKIMQAMDSPGTIASNVFDKINYSDTAYQYPVIGLSKTVDEITNDNIKGFYKSRYSPTNSFVVVVGHLPKDELLDLLNENLGSWQESDCKENSIGKPNSETKKIFIVHKDGATQTELRIGHKAEGRKAKDFYERYIANMVLGGQFSSRLNLNLREDKGFTYGIHSGFSYLKNKSTWQVDTAVDGKNSGASVKEILFEIEGINKNITEAEFDFAKSSAIKKFPSMFETYSQIARNVSLIPQFELDFNYFNNYLENIKNVEYSKVNKAAKKNFMLDKLNIIAVGDGDTLKQQMQEFSDFEIVELNLSGEKI